MRNKWTFTTEGVINTSKVNSRGQNTNQGSTETNQQQPTDITQKITNAHKQHDSDESEVNSGGPEE